MIKERCSSFQFLKLSSKRNSYFLCFAISMLSLFLLFDLSNDSAITTKKLQVCSIKLDTKVKALVMKEARFSKDLEMKDKRIANILERVKTLEQDKVQAAVVAREKLRSLE